MQTMTTLDPLPQDPGSIKEYLVVVWEHEARDQDELTLVPGAIIEVVERSCKDW
ncbi:Epidermal growth factor receptor kinase substrate 8-like protein 3 [Entomophthora muscae]|uniref:Epidermal growth factor receptor kinase substrate 8-like protein 3 n=1 Tax=Entomophthora muscae TaxID=34485 RepID=A0ACC2RQ53_9FUNG|nr:Epidermal growth factor receptor kinase substrate 8-like protein 3 [Entomophthora muscae]